MKKAAFVLLALLLATSCQAQRVDIVQRVADSHAAIARGEPEEGCTKLMHQRVLEEARHHCDVRGRIATLGARSQAIDADGRCQVELQFWCSAR